MGSLYEQYQEGLAPPKTEPIPPELAARYRALFTGGAGLEILAHLLTELGLFATLVDSDAVATHNFAIKMLTDMGVLKPNNVGQLGLKDVRKIIGALMSIAE